MLSVAARTTPDAVPPHQIVDFSYVLQLKESIRPLPYPETGGDQVLIHRQHHRRHEQDRELRHSAVLFIYELNRAHAWVIQHQLSNVNEPQQWSIRRPQ